MFKSTGLKPVAPLQACGRFYREGSFRNPKNSWSDNESSSMFLSYNNNITKYYFHLSLVFFIPNWSFNILKYIATTCSHKNFKSSRIIPNHCCPTKEPMGKTHANTCASHCCKAEILRRFDRDFSPFSKFSKWIYLDSKFEGNSYSQNDVTDFSEESF